MRLKNKSKLKLYKSVDDLSPISGAREALASGEEPQTTPSEKSVKFYLPIQVAEKQVDLKYPNSSGPSIWYFSLFSTVFRENS